MPGIDNVLGWRKVESAEVVSKNLPIFWRIFDVEFRIERLAATTRCRKFRRRTLIIGGWGGSVRRLFISETEVSEVLKTFFSPFVTPTIRIYIYIYLYTFHTEREGRGKKKKAFSTSLIDLSNPKTPQTKFRLRFPHFFWPAPLSQFRLFVYHRYTSWVRGCSSTVSSLQLESHFTNVILSARLYCLRTFPRFCSSSRDVCMLCMYTSFLYEGCVWIIVATLSAFSVTLQHSSLVSVEGMEM